jgi:bifunctional non-homologous end joining protein LigD
MENLRSTSGRQTPLVYHVDLLLLDGTDLRSRPLVEQRKLLAKLLKEAPNNIRFSGEFRKAQPNCFSEPRSSGSS